MCVYVCVCRGIIKSPVLEKLSQPPPSLSYLLCMWKQLPLASYIHSFPSYLHVHHIKYKLFLIFKQLCHGALRVKSSCADPDVPVTSGPSSHGNGALLFHSLAIIIILFFLYTLLRLPSLTFLGSATVPARAGTAMTRRNQVGSGASSSSFSSSSSSRHRACRRSTGCRVKPAGGAATSAGRGGWPLPGYPPPAGPHNNVFKAVLANNVKMGEMITSHVKDAFSNRAKKRTVSSEERLCHCCGQGVTRCSRVANK